MKSDAFKKKIAANSLNVLLQSTYIFFLQSSCVSVRAALMNPSPRSGNSHTGPSISVYLKGNPRPQGLLSAVKNERRRNVSDFCKIIKTSQFLVIIGRN